MITVKVAGYVRVSTDGQCGEDKFGIDNQRAIIEDYCAMNGHEIIAWYVDEGQSGVKESRPQLDKLLYGGVKNPPVEGVLVAKSDRVARDIKLYYYFLMLLEKKGMKLISCTEEVVNDDSGLGNVYKALMLFVAEQERENIKKRTSGGRKVKASQGGYSGGRPPYGYKAVENRLVIEKNEAECVRKVFELRKDGLTIRQIADELSGYVRKNGKPIDFSSVSRILSNERFYRGYYSYGGDGEVKGQHEPILED